MKKQAAPHTTTPQARRRMGPADQRLADLRMHALRAACRRCDEMGDGPEAREAMKRDVLDTPAELLADLAEALAAPIDRALLLAPAPALVPASHPATARE